MPGSISSIEDCAEGHSQVPPLHSYEKCEVKISRMEEIVINEKISYIKSSEDPLSADIGIVRDDGKIWLYDVGSDERKIQGLNQHYQVVISHFHQDHTGNMQRLSIDELYVSRESYKHMGTGTVVTDVVRQGTITIFPIPSSHCKGCLGMEIDGQYAFVGDALYSRNKGGYHSYNAQLLKAEIDVLKNIKAPYLLVSHFEGLIRSREEVIKELENIYRQREKNSSEIRVKRSV